MTAPEFAATVLSIALAGVGTWLLVREVDKAHKVEEVSNELAMEKELLELFRSDVREFWIRGVMRSGHHDRAVAERMAAALGDEAIRRGIDEYYGELYADVPRASQRWFELTVPAVLRQRRRDLWLGFALLIAGLGVQLAIAVGKAAGYW